MSVGLIEEKDIQKQLDELPEASRVWVEGLLARVAELEEQSSKDSKQEETLNQSLAELHAQYVELHDSEMEAQAQLGNLYASVEQMSSTLSHEEILHGVQEIVANLIGSEQLGIFEMDRAASKLVLVQQLGLDASLYKGLIDDGGAIAEVVAKGIPFFIDPDVRPLVEAEELTACVPLRVGKRVIGVLAIFALLPHKSMLTPSDISLLELLGSLAGHALYCTYLQAELGPITRAGS